MPRNLYPKTKGQSIPIIAVMIMVLIALVGLSVDVGNTYAEQRSAVRGANAAVLAGMQVLQDTFDDGNVADAIKASLLSNKIDTIDPSSTAQDGDKEYQAWYLDSSGDYLCWVGAVPAEVGGSGNCELTDAMYLKVQVKGTVFTYFARIMGRPTLPISAQSYAARGAAGSCGVYPIMINSQFVNATGTGFNPNAPGIEMIDSDYDDAFYKNKTQAKLNLKANGGAPGGFSWASWSGDGSAPYLEKMLTGSGNTSAFVEADWPTKDSSVTLQQPDGYPLLPGQLSTGDWLKGNSGISGGNGVKNALDFHLIKGTVVTLPIYDVVSGSGANVVYHIQRFGSFLIKGYDLTGNGSFDLVFLGPPTGCGPTLLTDLPKTNNINVEGTVYFKPRYKLPTNTNPIAFEIVLDTSGPMSWNWAGQGSWGGTKQCSGLTPTATCPADSTDAWSVPAERRIAIVKQALKDFITSFPTNGNGADTKHMMKIISFGDSLGSGDDAAALTQLTHVWPTNCGGWCSTKTNQTKLTDALDKATEINAVSNITKGYTPSAAALATAYSELNNTTGLVNATTYRKVVIFITGSPANVFRDGTFNSSSTCSPFVANCQVGYQANGTANPITAMRIQADNLKTLVRADKGLLYVVTIGDTDLTGLTSAASGRNSPFFQNAATSADITTVLNNIKADATANGNNCIPAGGDTWTSQLPLANVASWTSSTDATNKLPDGSSVGRVYITNPIGFQTEAKVTLDTSGNMVYKYTNMAPGTYQITAFVAYTSSVDNMSHYYSDIVDPSTELVANSSSFTLGASTTLNQTVQRPPLYLDTPYNIC